ncbi:hypothetical protein BP5796_02443 [Coleophoma crateriformis]|uniref:CorA-like transporter domain-containing protein n=1 Tax=Coleophoma crateriformis TaxID=565419 RepID=A0A3D8SZU6_9HELO|nr:hypothetical protein BP5796_02443 [Coleophoma crateriformis]
MATLNLPAAFVASYHNFILYPQKLIYQTSYRGAAEAYGARLDNAAPQLFTDEPDRILIPFRDLVDVQSGSQGILYLMAVVSNTDFRTVEGFVKQNILSDAALKLWLGDQSDVDANGAIIGPVATRLDPKCRFIFLSAGNSRNPLKLSRTMLVRILTYHQVMPIYLDFISVFGSQSEPRDLRFSGFREQCLISKPARGPAVPALGRSGLQIQLCYNLKAANCIDSTAKHKQWSIRQAAFHHQFDIQEGTTLWIITKGDLSLKERIQDVTGPRGKPEDKKYDTVAECFKNTMLIHLLYCHWATEDWRWYIQWLEEIIEKITSIALRASRDRSKNRHTFKPEDVLNVQDYEDKTNEAIMILEANMHVMTSLRKCYERLVEDKDFPSWKSTCREDVVAFADKVNDIIYDSEMQISRAKLLVRIISDRKNLIREHLQTQATEKMEDLTISNYKEAIAMRIITVVTLIYLPATFVSTFFSTDVIKYQNQNDDSIVSESSESQQFKGAYSDIALQRWFEVTIPLTLVTLTLGYYFYRRASKKSKEDVLPFYSDSKS